MKACSSAIRFNPYPAEETRAKFRIYKPKALLDFVSVKQEDVNEVYPSETIGRSSSCIMSQRMRVSDDVDVQVRFALNLEFMATDQEESSSESMEAMQILIQSRLLDATKPQLMDRFRGKVVVFHDGQILAEGETEADAVSKIPPAQRSLPSVVRRIDDEEPDFMGGPKGF